MCTLLVHVFGDSQSAFSGYFSSVTCGKARMDRMAARVLLAQRYWIRLFRQIQCELSFSQRPQAFYKKCPPGFPYILQEFGPLEFYPLLVQKFSCPKGAPLQPDAVSWFFCCPGGTNDGVRKGDFDENDGGICPSAVGADHTRILGFSLEPVRASPSGAPATSPASATPYRPLS